MIRVSPTWRTWILIALAVLATGYAVWFHLCRPRLPSAAINVRLLAPALTDSEPQKNEP